MGFADQPIPDLKLLWTDGPDASARLRALAVAGKIDAGERRDLAHFIRQGWLIKRAAIEPELIDRLVSDIGNHYRHPGKFLTTDHRNGKSTMKPSGATPDRFESLFDLYVNMKSARDVCFHPAITRFLSLVFEARPIAFQQLLFQRSNGHRLHQDSSVVVLEDPMLLAATWVALQDVVPGSGELAYYDRSHTLPHYLFKNGRKWMDFAVDDQNAYERDLRQACDERGFAYRKFAARKGDVFFWTADLVHASHPRTLPVETNRLSCVTHYHPAGTAPFWFRFHPDKRHTAAHGRDAGFESAYYVLPKGRGHAAPHLPVAG